MISLEIIFLLNIITRLDCCLKINKVVVRVPNPNDIGLIMDVTVTNAIVNDKREFIEFNVSPEKPCSINVWEDDVMENAGHIMGGNFGSIEAGAKDTVSLIWPTISLFNRVGSCSIVITSTNSKNEQSQLTDEIKFDTRFTTLDPECTSWRKEKNYKDCQNFDLDYLNDCKPVNCEERYFGRRNFFNQTKKRCEEVPCCSGNTIYDHFANECVDSQYTVTKEDIQNIKMGNFRSYKEWLELISTESAPNKFEEPEANRNYQKRESYDYNDNDSNQIMSTGSYFLKGIIDGLMLVFATIGIYVLICFVIFLVVSCVSRRQGGRNSVTFSRTPSISDKFIKLPSRSSTCKRRR